MPPLFHVQNSAIRWFNAPERFGGGKKPGQYEEEAVDVDAGVNEQRLLEQDAAMRAADAAELQRDQHRQGRRKRTRSDLFLLKNPYPDAEAEADEASWHKAAIRKLNRGRFRAAHPPTDSDRYIMRRRRWGQRAAAEDLPAGASSETEEDESNAADNARAALNRLPGKRRRFRDKEAADVAEEDLAHEGAYLNPDERADLADLEADEEAGKAEQVAAKEANLAYFRENFPDYKGSGRPHAKLTPDQRAKVKRLVLKLIPPKERGWTLERVARECPFTTKQNIIHYKLAYMICAGLRDPTPTGGFKTIESARTRWLHGGTKVLPLLERLQKDPSGNDAKIRRLQASIMEKLIPLQIAPPGAQFYRQWFERPMGPERNPREFIGPPTRLQHDLSDDGGRPGIFGTYPIQHKGWHDASGVGFLPPAVASTGSHERPDYDPFAPRAANNSPSGTPRSERRRGGATFEETIFPPPPQKHKENDISSHWRRPPQRRLEAFKRIRRLLGPDVKKWRARKQAAKEVWRNLTFMR